MAIRSYKEWCEIYVDPKRPTSEKRLQLMLDHGPDVVTRIEEDIEAIQRAEYGKYCRENGIIEGLE